MGENVSEFERNVGLYYFRHSVVGTVAMCNCYFTSFRDGQVLFNFLQDHFKVSSEIDTVKTRESEPINLRAYSL